MNGCLFYTFFSLHSFISRNFHKLHKTFKLSARRTFSFVWFTEWVDGEEDYASRVRIFWRNSVDFSAKRCPFPKRPFSGVNGWKVRHQFCSRYYASRRILDLRGFRTSGILREEVTVKAPRFPESVNEGDLRWSKKEGDSVAVDEVVCEIETDKTAIPVPSPVNGVLVKRLVEDGASVKAEQPIYVVKAGAGGAPAKPAAAKPAPAPPKAAAPPPPPKSAAPPPKPAAPSPAPASSAKAPAGALNLKRPTGTTAKDSVIVKIPPEDPTKEITGTRSEFRIPMNKMRQRIGQRLKEAQNTNAMLTTFNEIDMSTIMAFRKSNLEAFSKKHGVKLGFMSAFIKASCYALQDQPVINAVIDGTDVLYRDYVDISVAVATPKGLVVPVLRNVEHMNYGDIEKGLVQLAEKAKKGALTIEDMTGGTFTITNGGVFGSLLSTPIINMPQSAILGMHATFDRPVAVKGKVEIRPMMYVALTYDHRLVDGREAVLFLRKIKAAVEDPRIIVAGI